MNRIPEKLLTNTLLNLTKGKIIKSQYPNLTKGKITKKNNIIRNLGENSTVIYEHISDNLCTIPP